MTNALYELAKSKYQKALDSHIRLIALDIVKHSETTAVWEFYSSLAHDIGEKDEAIGNPVIEETDCEAIIQQVYDDLEETEQVLKNAISKEKDQGRLNLLVGKLDQLQQIRVRIESFFAEGCNK